MANKLSEQIYGSILKDIVSGVYAPREFISEAQIAAKYGVSKAPVKEAMHILASEGFLLSYPKRGYMVNVYTTEEINNIQEVRRALETLAMRKAIVTATDEELNALRFYQENEELQCRPGETVNTRFHMGIARLAKTKRWRKHSILCWSKLPLIILWVILTFRTLTTSWMLCWHGTRSWR